MIEPKQKWEIIVTNTAGWWFQRICLEINLVANMRTNVTAEKRKETLPGNKVPKVPQNILVHKVCFPMNFAPKIGLSLGSQPGARACGEVPPEPQFPRLCEPGAPVRARMA